MDTHFFVSFRLIYYSFKRKLRVQTIQTTVFVLTRASLVDMQSSRYSFFTARRNARIASAVLDTTIPSVCPSVCLSVCHTPVLCRNDCTYHRAVCTVR